MIRYLIAIKYVYEWIHKSILSLFWIKQHSWHGSIYIPNIFHENIQLILGNSLEFGISFQYQWGLAMFVALSHSFWIIFDFITT